MPVVANDVLRVSAEFEWNFADDIVAVFWVRSDVVVDPTPGLIAVEMGAWIETLYGLVQGLMSTKLTGKRVVVNNHRKDEFVGEADLTFAGTDATDALPPSVAALVVGRTTLPRTQARKYVGGLSEGVQVDGVLTAAAKATLQTFADTWDNQFVSVSGNTWTPGVLDRRLTAPPPPGDFLELSAMKVIPDTRTQRRRTLGRGS